MTIPASGKQWTITYGEQSATIVETGAALRSYQVGGVDVVAGFGADEPASSGRGQLLLPWPNRIRDGRYTFEGVEQQLPLSEPALGNASHGLVRWVSWRLLERSDAVVRLGYRLQAQPGWPGTLDLAIRYELTAEGLRVSIDATNVGSSRVPFGCGVHPYVAVGDTPRSDITLRIPASVQLLVDAERKLPLEIAPVEVDDHDFRDERALGDTALDTAFGELQCDADGRWRVEVGGIAGRAPVSVWGDASFGWVQIFTDKAADTGVSGTRGVAVEPLTCPADAFNSGTDLLVLEPGADWRGEWGIELVQE